MTALHALKVALRADIIIGQKKAMQTSRFATSNIGTNPQLFAGAVRL